MMKEFRNWLRTVRHAEEGVTAIEYALIAVLIAVVLIGGATLVGTGVNNTFNNVAENLQ
jgi:pilus assembly protein Flp/PilA